MGEAESGAAGSGARSRSADHDDVVRAEFSKQAASFENPHYSFGDPRLLRWILDHVPVEPGSLVLDVAGGTGHLARGLAPIARQVVVVDLTPAMLDEGRRQTEAAGIHNVRFELGDAGALSHASESFDLVVSRFAVHHFSDPARQLREMTRVCKEGGTVAVIDVVTAVPEHAASYNRLERKRDPSHANALSLDALCSLLERAGTTVSHTTTSDPAIDFGRWISQAGTPAAVAEEIRAELEAELGDGSPTGMRPLENDGGLAYRQRWAIVVAEKIGGTPA
jgi:ubiquinone/menaquinone biosynthesis C-methylase UbiE